MILQSGLKGSVRLIVSRNYVPAQIEVARSFRYPRREINRSPSPLSSSLESINTHRCTALM